MKGQDPGSQPGTLYSGLLRAALNVRDRAGQPVLGEALREVAETRVRAMAGSPRDGSGSAPDGLSNQVAYDAALIRLARCLGIECGPVQFEVPARGRQELQQAISAHGVELL